MVLSSSVWSSTGGGFEQVGGVDKNYLIILMTTRLQGTARKELLLYHLSYLFIDVALGAKH